MTRDQDRKFWIAMARAGGGAVFFSLPLLMTMEMWWLGFYIDPFRLAALLLVLLPLLFGLSYLSGFEETFSWKADVRDALIALLVGFVVAGVILWVLNIVQPGIALRDATGKIALQAVPASFGAVLANSQFSAESGSEERENRRRRAGTYPGELFHMVAGAIFFAFNIAPTEEVLLLAYKLTPVHMVALLLLTLLMMDGFVYGAGFRGRPDVSENTPWWSLFLRFTAVGYVLAMLVSAYVLWTFDRFAGHALDQQLAQILVLCFPAGLGAAAARLVL